MGPKVKTKKVYIEEQTKLMADVFKKAKKAGLFKKYAQDFTWVDTSSVKSFLANDTIQQLIKGEADTDMKFFSRRKKVFQALVNEINRLMQAQLAA